MIENTVTNELFLRNDSYYFKFFKIYVKGFLSYDRYLFIFVLTCSNLFYCIQKIHFVSLLFDKIFNKKN